jgi:hypothetical protein
MKKSMFNQIPTESKSAHQARDVRTAGTTGPVMSSGITASETLNLESLAMDEDPIAAERPLTALVRFCNTVEETECF